MPESWQDEEQKLFFEENLALYSRGRDEGTLKKTFWPMIIKEWFERWPLSEPPAELVEKNQGAVEKATKVWRNKKVEVSIFQ